MSNLPPLDEKLGAKKWVPKLVEVEVVTPFFHPREHIYAFLHPPVNLEPKMVNSRRNVTGVFNCWRKLTPETIAGREMTMTPLDMYQLTGQNMIGGRVIHILELANDVHLDQIYLGFSVGSTSMNVPSLPDEFSGGSTIICNSSHTVAVNWLYFFEDLERTVEYNWGGQALAHLYVNMDAVSRGSTTSLMSYWQLWEGLPSEGMDERVALAWRLVRFSKLYEGPSMRALYLAERVTTQLIGGE
uniref:Aminotransferase-like plant mobile domain-containing protein n=1 Tax=Fagus sylvatica TaxID=28930 RepID=A0A2N9FVK5_FAGSY